MKKIKAALSVASAITCTLAWAEEHRQRPNAELLAFQLKKEHALIGLISGILILVS